MIRVNLLKAKSSSAGGLESLETPRDATFIARREIALGALFLIAGALFLFFQFRLWQSSGPVVAGSEQASQGEYIDAIMDEETADSTDTLSQELGASGPEVAADTSGYEGSSRSQRAGASPDPTEPAAPQLSVSPEGAAPADKPSPGTGTSLAGPSSKLTQLVVSRTDEALRIFALTGQAPEYSTFRLDSPKRVVVDLKGVQVGLPRSQIQQTIGHSQVLRVRVGQFQIQPPKARLVLDVESYPEIEFLPQFNGLYLVVTGQRQ